MEVDLKKCIKVVVIVIAILFALINPQISSATSKAPIEHVIVILQANRSFDHYFGTYPGANGFPKDLAVPVDPFNEESNTYVKPFHLESTRTIDPAHSERIAKIAYNDGLMNGFIYIQNLYGRNGSLVMGYYDYRELPYYWNFASEYVLCDNFFSPFMGSGIANYLYLCAGTSGGYRDVPPEGIEIRTIFDVLEEKGISWKVYINNYNPEINYTNTNAREVKKNQLFWMPLLAMPRYVDNSTLFSKIVDIKEYSLDLKSDSFPNVSYLVLPGRSEHAPGDVTAGQRFVASLVHELMRSKYWYNSVFILTYDESGLWYDHVPPPQVDDEGYGFRVPALIISPYAKKGYIDNTLYDTTSILKFIEWLYDLPPLAERDAKANNLLNAFDFTQTPRKPVIMPPVYQHESQTTPLKPWEVQILYAMPLFMILSITIIWMMLTRNKDGSER